MDAHEPHRVVSINVKPSSWPRVERLWPSATRGVLDATVCKPCEAITAHATDPIGKLTACQPLARDGARVTFNGSASTALIQYP